MSSLPTWIGWAIVAACPLLGPVIAFLIVLPIAVLDRWITRAREAPAVVFGEAGVIGGYTRRRMFRRALAHSEPAAPAPLRSPANIIPTRSPAEI
jgi:hypothetical protein